LRLSVNPKIGETYNIGGNYTCTVGEMLNYLISISSYSKKINLVENPSLLRPLDADLQVPDISKFQNHTGWSPQITFEDTMADLLNYWREKVRKGNYLPYWT
jgi:GDPmannose 4,6-dehydratase